MMLRFTTGRLLGAITVIGLGYAVWFAAYGKDAARERARVCRVNRNLIDAYVLFWEARAGYLDTRLWHTVSFETSGAVAESPAGVALKPGATAIAEVALDPDAFRCPEAPTFGGPAVHYRWTMSPDPAPELAGRRRGAVCLVHR